MSDQMTQAIRAAQQIESRINKAIDPLKLEMRIMDWKPEYRAIIWKALAHRCLALVAEARKEMEDKP